MPAPMPTPMPAPMPPIPQMPTTIPIAQPEHQEVKGWTFVNILLVIILICCCLTSIVNIINGQVLNGILAIICLCLFYWFYSYYNRNDPSMPKMPANLGGININVGRA
jgi:hypothetical protein